MYKEKIDAGVAWLDKRKPGWRTEIDLKTLDVSDCDYCVLGQVFGHYADGLAFASRKKDSSTASSKQIEWSHAHGFAGLPGYFRELTEEWKERAME